MPGQDTTAYDEVMKTVYEGGIRQLIPTRVPVLEMFEERDATPWGGRYVEYPIKISRNQGSGWGTELGNLPAAGRQRYTSVRIPMRYQYGRMQLSAQVIKASEGAKNAFAPAMEQEMKGLITDMTSDRGRAIFGDGRGILALVNGSISSTTITIDAPGGIAGATNGARFVNPGMLVTTINPATGALRNGIKTIDTVPAAGTTFTITATGTVADNDYIVRAMTTGSTDVSDTGYQKEFMGLSGLVDDGTNVATLHNVNRTTYPMWQSRVIASVGALSADVLQRGIDLADQVGDGDITDLLMHHSLRRSYLSMMENDRRYAGGDLSNPDAGTRAAKKQKLAFGGIPITVDKYHPYGTVFGIDRSAFRRYVEVAGEWMNEDGSILSRVGTGSTAQDAFEALYRIWDNFHCEYPNKCFRLDGVTGTVVVAHID